MSDCQPTEAAGVVCEIEQVEKRRKKRQSISIKSLIEPTTTEEELTQTGANILGSAMAYFEEKEKEKQKFAENNPDAADADPSGVEIKMHNKKGYKDLGGEFQAGGIDVEIQEVKKKHRSSADGGQAFIYPLGLSS